MSILLDSREIKHYRLVFNPLVLDAPREPFPGSSPTHFEFRVLWSSNGFSHHLVQPYHRLKDHRLSRTSKEHQGPTGVFVLLAWRLAECVL